MAYFFNLPKLPCDTAVMGEAQEFVSICDTGDCMECLEDAWDESCGCPPEQAVGALAQEKIDALKKMCFCCGCKARCKTNCYTVHAARVMSGAPTTRQTRRGESQLKAFQAIKKRGGPEFITAIQAFKAQCAGHGRGWVGPAFD